MSLEISRAGETRALLSNASAVKRAADYDQVFQRRSGWTGADGAYSLPLSTGKVLWLFSDTLIGKVQANGQRDLSAAVPINCLGVRALHNSAAVQDNPDPKSIRFFIPGGLAKPGNLFDPPDGNGWFWVSAGAANPDGSATVLLNQFVRSDDPKLPFGKQTAVWTCETKVEGERVVAGRYRRLDSLGHLTTPETVWGSSVLVDGPWTYVYGARGNQGKQLMVARVPTGHLADSNAYRFFDGKNWLQDLNRARPLHVPVSNEFSVQKVQDGYLLTTDEMSGPVSVRFSKQPHGPWSKPLPIWQPTEPAGNVFTYNSKAHPELTTSDGLLISYNVNSFDEKQSLHEAEVYRPRFIRVPAQRVRADAFKY